jgi:uncharacterized protein
MPPRRPAALALERIAILDALRGAAILLILFVNIGEMGASETVRAGLGWPPTDAAVFAFFRLFLFGTQRGLLQLLFGAGIVILAGRRSPRLFYRRSLLLAGFGLVNVFALLWEGDVLVVYGLVALFVFPLHRLRVRWLLLLVPLYACWSSWHGWPDYVDQRRLAQAVAVAREHRREHVPFTQADLTAMRDWQAQRIDGPPSPAILKDRAAELHARQSGVFGYARLHWHRWLAEAASSFALVVLGEAAATMVLGMALWKLGIIQGRRSRGFYLVLMLAGYAAGIAARGCDLPALFAFRPDPSPAPLLQEWGRLAIVLGHLALVNLLAKRGWALRPLQAAGRGAFSIYMLQSAICLWIVFAPWGPPLWNRLSYPGLSVVALAIDAVLLLAATWWFRRFAIGPLEWVWRSLAYGERQPWHTPRPVLPA